MRLPMFASSVLVLLQQWRDELAPEEISTTPLPIIVVPRAWMEKVRQEMRFSDNDKVEAVYDCSVLVDEEMEPPMSVPDPVIIRHDGKTIVLDRTWRTDAAKLQAAAEKRERRDKLRLVNTQGERLH